MSVLSVSFAAAFTALSLRAQTPEEQRLGLRPPTEEERGWMDQNMQQTKAVRLNALGLERINADRRDKRLPELVTTLAVHPGLEPAPWSDASTIVSADGEPRLQIAGEIVGVALPAAVDNTPPGALARHPVGLFSRVSLCRACASSRLTSHTGAV